MSKNIISRKVLEDEKYKTILTGLSTDDRTAIEDEVKIFAERIESFAEKLLSIANDPEMSAKYRETLIRIRERSGKKE